MAFAIKRSTWWSKDDTKIESYAGLLMQYTAHPDDTTVAGDFLQKATEAANFKAQADLEVAKQKRADALAKIQSDDAKLIALQKELEAAKTEYTKAEADAKAKKLDMAYSEKIVDSKREQYKNIEVDATKTAAEKAAAYEALQVAERDFAKAEVESAAAEKQEKQSFERLDGLTAKVAALEVDLAKQRSNVPNSPVAVPTAGSIKDEALAQGEDVISKDGDKSQTLGQLAVFSKREGISSDGKSYFMEFVPANTAINGATALVASTDVYIEAPIYSANQTGVSGAAGKRVCDKSSKIDGDPIVDKIGKNIKYTIGCTVDLPKFLVKLEKGAQQVPLSTAATPGKDGSTTVLAGINTEVAISLSKNTISDCASMQCKLWFIQENTGTHIDVDIRPVIEELK